MDTGSLTFRDKSTIDYAITSVKAFKMLKDFEILDLDRIFSDGHACLHVQIACKQLNTLPNPESDNAPSNNIYLNPSEYSTFLQNFDRQKMEVLLNSLQTCDTLDLEQINYATDQIADAFLKATQQSKNVTKTEFKDQNQKCKPWFGHECKNARKKYFLAKRIHNRRKTVANKENLIQASKSYKRTLNKHINKYTKRKQNKLRYMAKHEPKEYWKFLNSLKRKTKADSPSVDSFHDYFKDLYSCNTATDIDHEIQFDFENAEESLNRPFTSEEIQKCIGKLKNSKSPGFDNILNEHIKLTKDLMTPMYVTLFNVVLNTGNIPEKWLIGKIKPIYKNKGDILDPENYRPISLLSCLGKLFTALLSERLNTYLEENDILNENQAGFRKDHSTIDHIFALHALIEIMKFEKKKLFCSYIDFSKAFDSVWRIGLWRKLLRNEINGNFFRVIHNMYQNIKSCVSVGGENSLFFTSNCGVRQGDNLSPVLFSMFLNDLEDHMMSDRVNGISVACDNDQITYFMKIYILLYADDTLILSDSPEAFQDSLNSFHNYCADWKLTVNMNKSKIMIFGARKVNHFSFYLGDTNLEIVNSYKYLGTFFTPTGSFLQARKHIASQANKAMHLLNMRINNLDLPVDLQLKLFDNTILPILTYACEVWGFESCKLLEPIHNQFLRKLLHARKSTPLYMIYAELGRYPLEITIKTRMIAYWSRIISGSQNKLSYMLYHKLTSTPGLQSKWVTKVRETLQNCGRADIWLNQPNNTNITAMVKGRLLDQFYQEWNANIEVSSKGRNYRIFKNDPSLENYLLKLPKSLYIKLAKFRTGNHRFPCETGRYHGIDYSERKCTLCDNNDIGDEMHYFLICPFFQQQRAEYLPKYYYTRPNTIKFKELMNVQSVTKLKRMCQFIGILLQSVK